jgi:Tol biopolymer transport system component
MPSPSPLIRPATPATARAKRGVAVVAGLCAAGLATGAGPALAAFPGANGSIAFTSDRAGTADVWAMRPNGSELANLTPDSPADDALPNWRADGRKIVFASDRKTRRNPVPAGFLGPDFELFTMNADGSHVRQITFNEFDDDDPAWSPDGTRLVFIRDFDPLRGEEHLDYDILTMRVSGAHERNLTDNPGRDSAPNWSPDGRRIVFDSERSGGEEPVEIYTMGIDGSRVRRLTNNQTFDGQPNWSPNGRKVSFQSYREGQLAIYTMRRDGSHQQRLTRDVPDAFGSAWSPDGRIVAHSSFSDPEIFTIDLHGRDEHELTDDPSAFDFAPDWQPLARSHR